MKFVFGDTEHPDSMTADWLPPMLPLNHDLSQLRPRAHTHTQKHFPARHSPHALLWKLQGIYSALLTNSQCSVLADKLIPIIFKYGGGSGGSSRSSLFSIMLSALNIVYSICTRAGRRLLWSVLFFEQSISDIALFSWDRVIFSLQPADITQPLMESWCRHPYPPWFE